MKPTARGDAGFGPQRPGADAHPLIPPPPAPRQHRAEGPHAVPGRASLTSGRGQRGPARHKQTARPGPGAAMTQGPEPGREAESFVPMTSPGGEGGRGPAPGKGGLAGGPAWGRARSGAPRAGRRGREPPPRAPSAERRAPSPEPRPAAHPAFASEERVPPACEDAALPSAPEAAASILLRPCILITAALIFMSRDSRGTAGCHFPRPRTPPPRTPLPRLSRGFCSFPLPAPPVPTVGAQQMGGGVKCEQECEQVCVSGQEGQGHRVGG